MHLQIKLDAVEIGGLGNVGGHPDRPGKLAILGVARKHFRNRMGKGYSEYREHTFVTFVLDHEFHSALYRILSNLNDGSLLFADKPLLTEIFLPPDGRREEMQLVKVEPFMGRECLFIFEREVVGSLLNPHRYLYAVAKKLTKELREVAQIIRDSERETAAVAVRIGRPLTSSQLTIGNLTEIRFWRRKAATTKIRSSFRRGSRMGRGSIPSPLQFLRQKQLCSEKWKSKNLLFYPFLKSLVSTESLTIRNRFIHSRFQNEQTLGM